ncbi:AAA family ATPase [Aureibacillus halotolerans]|uniref:Shikimate kinase n=1 Tax=Aureibacillus halotolerans TaxID=1508390 RepID=A0A4R6U714_9BACI|nr:AAA family ATPase [Aureibacillus halotolerans]TDQ40673.1 shikimate kinase [Aureibacillus halotolerans]
MSKVILFITGMSGTGKTTILSHLNQKGYKTIETDDHPLVKKTYNPVLKETDWIWDKHKIQSILNDHTEGILFLSGAVSNQSHFYAYFDEVICFSAPLETILSRVEKRTTNPYGKTEAERNDIIDNFERFAGIIQASATVTIDTTRDIHQNVKEIEALALLRLSNAE